MSAGNRRFAGAAGAVHMRGENRQPALESRALARRARRSLVSANEQFKPLRAALAVVFV